MVNYIRWMWFEFLYRLAIQIRLDTFCTYGG